MTAPDTPLPSVAYLALGSNLGDRRANLSAALDHLRATPGVRVVRVSSFYENPAVGGPADSPPFVNAAASVETSLSPHDLLRRLLDIERAMGRRRRERWEPRLIDLDLLMYGDLAIDTPELTLPHPRMHERRFVLQPLAEIAPAAVHPRENKTVDELLRALPRRSGE